MISWVLLAAFYLVARFALTSQLDSFGAYACYIFEVANVGIGMALLGRPFLKYFEVTRRTLVCSIGSLVAGFAIFRGAQFADIQVPFNLAGTETLLFLLIVAPILEELIFRFFVWQPIEFLSKNTLATWLITSLLFSYSHLHAIWFVPEKIHQFILYQTAYTLLLGLACGFFVFKKRSLAGAMMIHFTFNLGFYLGSLV